MKLKIKYIAIKAALVAAAACLCSCTGQLGLVWLENDSPATVAVQITVRPQGGTKSALYDCGDDTAIDVLHIAAYRNGWLAGYSCTDGATGELELISGDQYNIYALAGIDDFEAPYGEADLAGIRVGLPAADPFDRGLPMVCADPVTILAGPQTVASIEMVPLVCRCDLSIDDSLLKCAFVPTSIRLCQVAADIMPFAGSGAAVSVRSGDYASASDLEILSYGGTISFYVPENCQGVLLPDNDDPWKKDAATAGLDDLCTYLEVAGTWTTPGAEADLCFKMYLGADNCTDFNVRRGTVLSLTMYMSDASTIYPSWKVTRNMVSDTRALSPELSEVTVMQGLVWTEVVLSLEPADVIFDVSVTGDGTAGLEYEVSDGILRLRSTYTGPGWPEARIEFKTWDGLLLATMDVRVDYIPGKYTSTVADPVSYVGQWGGAEFPDATVEMPVSVTVGDSTFVLDGVAGECRHFVNAASSVEYYFYGDRLYYCTQSPSLADTVKLSRWKDRGVLEVPAMVNPQIKAPDIVLSEGGNCITVDGIECDAFFDVNLLDDGGNVLDLGKFAVPDGLLSAQGLKLGDAYRFGPLLKLYPATLSFTGATASYSGKIRQEGSCNSYLPVKGRNSLGGFYVYGLAGVSDDITLGGCTVTAGPLSSSGTVTVLKAFPSQRHLGEFCNRQLDPGVTGSDSLKVDFSSAGMYHSPYGNISWDFRHSKFGLSDIPSTSYASGTVDTYCAGLSFDGNCLHFAEMTPLRFAPCGGMSMRGTVCNPHDGKTIYGYYNFDLVLYLPIGAQIDLFSSDSVHSGTIGVSAVPFCEYSTPAYSALWNSCFFSGTDVTIGSSFGQNATIRVPSGPDDNSIFVSLTGAPALGTADADIAQFIRKNIKKFDVVFLKDAYGGLHSRDFSRDGLASISSLAAYADGSKGYYDVRLQYETGGAPTPVPGWSSISNYVLEASLGSFTLY